MSKKCQIYVIFINNSYYSYSNKAYPDSIRNYVIENYFELLKSCSAQTFSAEMTITVCEPIIHAVAYCENKAFFKQSSEALIQGLLPGAEGDEDEEGEECDSNVEELENSGLDEEEECDTDDDEIESSGSDENEESLSEEDCESELEFVSGEEVDFDSEDFDNIKNDNNDSESSCSHEEGHCEDEEMLEEEPFIFDYSLLSKFIFEFGAREDVLVRNRRFLYELSQIIGEVATGIFESCCGEDDTCCN